MYVLFWELLLIIVPLIVSTTDIDPCVTHTELRDSHRSQFYKISALDVAHCDKDLTTGWYRFKGKAGLQISDKCVDAGSCGTHAPGWFKGSHPTVLGAISSGTVCFNWIGFCCRWSTPVRVKKCDGFFVYLLPQTAFCDLQYCGDGSADPECAADNNDIAVNGSVPGFLSNPNFPNQFPSSLQCTWRITAAVGMKVRLVLKNVTLGSNDYIVFRDGLQENSTQIAKYANFSANELRLYSTDRYMLVNFVSNESKALSDFRLEYQSVMSKDENKSTATSSPSTTTKPDDYAMDVICDKDEINVVLHIRSAFNYDPKSVRLNDASCKPAFQNNTYIFVKSTLEGCGTTSYVSTDGKMIVYRNAICADVINKYSIGLYATRDHQAVFEFQCRYKRRTVLSTVSFDPSKLYIITDLESFGNFTFEMNMFKSGRFREYYTEYPVGPIDVGAKIFLQVSVKSNDSGLVVLVEECKATPSADYNDEVHYIFIEKGCSKDKTLQYNYTLSAVQRFSLSAFSFRFEKSGQIYFHCQVRACRRSEPTSRCAEGCPFGKRKKRGSQDEVDQFLAIGPIIVSPETVQAMKKTVHQPPEDGIIAFAVLAGVLGLIVLVLIAALVLIFKSRQTPNSNGAATLLVRDEPDYG